MGASDNAIESRSAAAPWGVPELAALRDRLRGPEPPRYDLVVVGAGISGAGVARDAAMRGLSVLVLEGADVAFGTSSRSSRLIHGGVRYLEQGQLGLVYEALRERSRLYAAAPHLVVPARFLFPSYAGDRLAPWKLRAGLALYDLLSLYRGQAHGHLSPRAAREAEPLLLEAGLQGAVQYEDAVTDDARLTLTVLQSAVAHGAEVLTYARVGKISRTAADDYRVALADGGAARARAVLLATGPWTGTDLLGEPGADLLSLSRGVHLVLRHSDLPVRAPVVVQVRGQRRILFVVPWGTRTYLGTTDTEYRGDPGRSSIDGDDEREVLGLVGRVLGGELHPSRIIAGWSGVRPLVRAARSRGGTEELARTHRIVCNEAGVFALVGGKLTTYRAMAEEAVDRIVARLREVAPPSEAAGSVDAAARLRALRPCATTTVPLVPGDLRAPAAGEEALAAALYPRHGARARALAARCEGRPELAAPLVDDLPYRWIEVEQAIAHEGVRHLDDLLRRRLPLALTDLRRGEGVARKIARRLVDAQGGGEAEVEREVERYRELVGQETGRPLDPT